MATKKADAEEKAVEEEVPILLEQYFERYRPDVHDYTKAYVSVEYRGILKTRLEWDSCLANKV